MRNLKPALDLIKEFEGIRLHSYQDTGGVWTIGWGTTVYPDGRKVGPGQSITSEQADEFMMYEVRKKADSLEYYIKVKVTDNQFGALLSFAYNIGAYGFQTSTLLKKLNAGDYLGAANEFKRWNKDNGKVEPGLVRRRSSEEAVFRKDLVEMPSAPKETTPDWVIKLMEMLQKVIALLSGPKDPKVEQQQPILETPKTKTLSAGSGPRISREEVEAILKKQGADTSKVCLLGIRGYYLDSMGTPGANDRRIYDDALIWFFPEGFMTYRANVDPNGWRKGYGVAESTKGMANLKEGHWQYRKGIHKTYPAFIQAAKVTVVRDGNPDYEDTGWFGINIHMGGTTSTSSLGCQTIPPAQWKSFKELGYGKLDQYNQSTFSYVLIKEEMRRS